VFKQAKEENNLKQSGVDKIDHLRINPESRFSMYVYGHTNLQLYETLPKNADSSLKTKLRATRFDVVNGAVRLHQFGGFSLFGTRHNAPFILPVWGFFKTARRALVTTNTSHC
jgi:hypothetical protein